MCAAVTSAHCLPHASSCANLRIVAEHMSYLLFLYVSLLVWHLRVCLSVDHKLLFDLPRRALWQVYEPPRYMTVAEAVAQLLEVEAAEGGGAYGPDTLAVGVARLGSPDQLVCRIRSCPNK